MFGEEKKLKDSEVNLGISITDNSLSISYTKTNKLITALYMVTDVIDKDEPLRNRLRTLGTGIISDINSIPANISAKISQVMSFLDIASAVNIISEMNCNILKKEFSELNQAIKESSNENKTQEINRKINLSEFFRESAGVMPTIRSDIGHPMSNRFNRIGVQKGSTLMKALSDKDLASSMLPNKNTKNTSTESFNTLKKQRNQDIINIIKLIGREATIKDIKDKIREIPEKAGTLNSCGEKTLQRELASMVKDGVLKKTGEKRWSKYFL